jgi:hypothetical protein
MDSTLLPVLSQIAHTLAQIEQQLSGRKNLSPPDFTQQITFSWKKQQQIGQFHAILHPKLINLDDLVGIDRQKTILIQNTEQFLADKPANNALLWGAKGTGKSSIIKGLLERYAAQGLRVIEIDRHDLVDIPEITEVLRQSDKKFILFCDDLSFEAADVSYKALKVALDGGMTAIPDNVLIYATSNRRHLLPEYMADNLQSQVDDLEVHYADAIEEKISLSERFGIWLSFYQFREDAYLEIVQHWFKHFGLVYNDTVAKEALMWARTRASKSGRAAYQFAVDWAGRQP